MDAFSIISLLGGLALFLYGMRLMGEGLEKLASNRLEKILARLTGRTSHAVILGAAITAIIQSSSATTVMVVGFVNSGIMSLRQAVGVIMGANIGTTMTSWIFSMTGIQSESIWVRMLKPSSFAPIVAMIGIILLMTARENIKKTHAGSICIGFGILMYGMETMSKSMVPLAESDTFASILMAVSNPIFGIVVGMIFTAVIQSSSASVGILQALCLSGTVTFAAAIPIVLGQNIGTCATALLSSVGASKNAKRASMIHLYFNLIGTIVFVGTFYTANMFFNFDFLYQAASPVSVAIIHSIFNIGCTVVLYPFANRVVTLAEKTIKDDYTHVTDLRAGMKV